MSHSLTRAAVETSHCVAFIDHQRLTSGPTLDVAIAVKAVLVQDPGARVFVFDAETSHRVDLDFRGSEEDLRARLAPVEPASERVGPGRPKLGVVAREVTLLPRHWDWLNQQPGGASVALRKLVEEARKAHAEEDLARARRESAYRFMSAMAGDLTGFEEASRALFAGRLDDLRAQIAPWPTDVRDHLLGLLA